MTTMDNNNSCHPNRFQPSPSLLTGAKPSLANKLPVVAASAAGSSSASSSGAAMLRASQQQQHHHKGGSFRSHQRRQSVARLLPDISKLRLLSWLVEASSELINCNIAIMDGVYAKLNKSQESLLFWNNNGMNNLHHLHSTTTTPATNPSSGLLSSQQQSSNNIPSNYIYTATNNNSNNITRPPPTPLLQPVANKIVISQQKQRKKNFNNNIERKKESTGTGTGTNLLEGKKSSSSASRNHHSLPLTNYDASSMAAVSFISAGSSSLSRRSTRTSNMESGSDNNSMIMARRQASAADTASVLSNIQCDSSSVPLNSLIISEVDAHFDNNNNNNNSDSNQSDGGDEADLDEADLEDDEEDDNSSAASSTTSSGIHGAGTSSSISSASSSGSSSTSSCSSASTPIKKTSNSNSKNSNSNNKNKKAFARPTTAGFSLRTGNKSKQQQLQATTKNSLVSPNSVCDTNNYPGGAKFVSSAEQLSEKIRRTVMEHNYIQNLLVNIIRQHDKQRDQLNQQQQRRRQMSCDNTTNNSSNQLLASGNRQQVPLNAFSSSNNQRQQYLYQHRHHHKIDLADIADSLDDGCLCLCHSEQQHRDRSIRCLLMNNNNNNNNNNPDLSLSYQNSQQQKSASGKSSTLPATSTSLSSLRGKSGPNLKPLLQLQLDQLNLQQQQQQQQQIVAGNNQVPERKVRRLKKLRGGFRNNNNSNNNELSRQDLIDKLADKLCENCFETHYWLHGNSACSGDELLLMHPLIHQFNQYNCNHYYNQEQLDQLDTIISKRNATFIRLVQQEVRSTISKSIELIDLIRKEIKSPDSIKQKQLMRCFSTSIQLLTSVGNYVVPAQDISSFIPEIGQHQTSLFSLPTSDFDHLLLYQSYPPALIGGRPAPSNSGQFNNNNNNNANNILQQANNYHLASAPDIPVRRKFNLAKEQQQQQQQQMIITASSKTLDNKHLGAGKEAGGAFLSSSLTLAEGNGASFPEAAATATAGEDESEASKVTTSSTTTTKLRASNESSSGASSNNSSASSSIARGAVQQSSLTRVQTSSAILDGKTSHDLSYDAIASLSRQQTEDDMLFQSRPKFWQSSKFNFIKKLLHVKEQRLLRQQSKDRRIYNNKVQNKFRLVMMDLTHFNKSQQLLTTENGVNSLLTSMRNVLEFGLYLTLKLY